MDFIAPFLVLTALVFLVPHFSRQAWKKEIRAQWEQFHAARAIREKELRALTEQVRAMEQTLHGMTERFRTLTGQIRAMEQSLLGMTERSGEPGRVDSSAPIRATADTDAAPPPVPASAAGPDAVRVETPPPMAAAGREKTLFTDFSPLAETAVLVPDLAPDVAPAAFGTQSEAGSASGDGDAEVPSPEMSTPRENEDDAAGFPSPEVSASRESDENVLLVGESAQAVAPAANAAPVNALARELEEAFRVVMGFIRGGNIWVAGGVIMLLIGFAFLARLGMFPIELRIILAAVTGMGMVGLGLYLRLRRRMYALVMQGGGIGVLYLTVFASAKLTTLLPPWAALLIMMALIIPAVALAVTQNAQVLALFGFVGGFAAPILLSDGSGNYIALFSCYTLLNLGILSICRYRLWRWLNFAGAFCTFVVMGIWGISSYDVSKFATTEPFLLGFVLIYILLTLGSVRRANFSFTAPLDAILACGIPFVGALFQWHIVKDIPHGLSISALAFGAFFILLAFGVWRLWGERARRLAEFYLANGAVLVNLAVPLELSGNVTSTAWAVEGAIFFFFACRYRSARIKCVALLLQGVGMAAFFSDLADADEHTLLSTSLISLAALASACFQKLEENDAENRYEGIAAKWLGKVRLAPDLAVLGLLWWYGGVALEAARFAERPLVMFFLTASLSSVPLYFAEKKTGLRELFLAGCGVPLLTAACCLLAATGGDFLDRAALVKGFDAAAFNAWLMPLGEARQLFLRHNFLTGWSALAWAVFAVTQAGMLRLRAGRMNSSRHAWWIGIVALELLFMLTSSGRGAALDLGLSRAWGSLASIFPTLAFTLALVWLIRRHAEGRTVLFTPDHARVLGGAVPAILFVPLGLWLVFSFFSLGRPAPLPFFVPLLNPLELKQALCIATFALWQRAISQAGGIPYTLSAPNLLLTLDALLFLWLHSMLFRAIAHFTGTPMGLAWEHESFQVLLTVLWGVWGMGHLVAGNRKRIRRIWVIGATLILLDTAKLFLVDLADKDTLFRVLSFFVLGGIFLLIGWLAPLPQSRKNDADEPEPETPLTRQG